MRHPRAVLFDFHDPLGELIGGTDAVMAAELLAMTAVLVDRAGRGGAGYPLPVILDLRPLPTMLGL